jgi:hypothetical protein
VGYWPFNGNANDETLNGNNGVVSNCIPSPNRFGIQNSAYGFNGINSIISINDFNDSIQFNPLVDSYSLVLWFKSADPCVNTPSSRLIENWFGSTVSGYPFSMSVNNANVMSCAVFDGTFFTEATVGSQIFDNQWRMVAFIVNNQTDSIQVYINNTLVASEENGLSLSTSPFDSLYIGNDQSVTRPFSGLMDDLRIYNRALSQNDITALYYENICFETITVTDTLVINANLTGFSPVVFQNTVKMYPNPTNDQLTIDFGNNYASLSGYTLAIKSSNNQTVFLTQVTQQQVVTNLNTWNGNGIYFVNFFDASGNLIDVKKIIIQ